MYLADGVFVMKDNVAIEFGMPPCVSEEEWLTRLADSYDQLSAFIPNNLRLKLTPSARFPEEELQTDEACQFGCDPDFNAWSKSVNVPPRATQTNFRSCGGHIHIGYVEGTTADYLLQFMGKVNTVRMMDGLVGVPSIILDNTPESRERRQLYGKAGCYRATDYGVEYRTLSNFWLKNVHLQQWVYRATGDVVRNLDEAYTPSARWVGTRGKGIQNIINKGDVDTAQVFLDREVFPFYSPETTKAFKEAERLI